MNQDILLSKIVPNSTDTTWSQAYTTFNVYMALSLEKEDSKTPVTQHGKELLEKLQREFFALDEKNLDNIKRAVSNAIKHIGEGYNYSVIVGAIVGDILYIVIASDGQVVIKRGERIGIVATGVTNELHGFSGRLNHNDIILLETGDFNKKIPVSSLSEQLASNDVLKIAEDITPLIHDGSKGTEGAIILQFKSHAPQKDALAEAMSGKEDEETNEEKDDLEESESIDEKDYEEENLWTKPPKEEKIEDLTEDNNTLEEIERENRRRFPLPPIPKINFKNRRVMIIGAILVLVLLLFGGVYYQISSSNNAKLEAEFATVFDPIQAKYDEAVELEELNKTLALEEYNKALELVNQALANYEESSDEYQRLSDLESQIETNISNLGGGGSAKNVTELITVGDDIESITAITAKGGSLLVLDSTGEQVAVIDDNGSIDETYDIETEASFISANDNNIFVMGETAVRIDRGNGNVSEITDDISGKSFDIFGTNIYTLTGDDILKHVPPSYQGTSYFADETNFEATPVDIAISGPVYVLLSNGQVERFNRGEREDFNLNGISSSIGEGAKIYAEPNLDNIYILDVKNQRVVSFDEEGEFITQYEGSFIKDATSFAIDEENEFGYVLSNEKVIRFDL